MEIHKVRRGDTLGKIAKKYGVKIAEIRRVNPEITNPNTIRVGQMIDIPSVAAHEPNVVETESTVESGPIAAEIIAQAKRFVNLFEIESNAKWDDPSTSELDASGTALRVALEHAGWQAGWPYCAAFCEAIWRLAYAELGAARPVLKSIGDRLNPSVMQSFKNWKKAGAITITPKPESSLWIIHAEIQITPWHNPISE